MPTTPREKSDEIDKEIDDFNARWDLRLPKLHGAEARKAELEPAKKSPERKCSSLIRFLHFKTDFDRVRSKFDESARQILSRWIFKPSQEIGTLPSLPITKSLVARDLREKRASGAIKLTGLQRTQLTEHLLKILEEEYLAHISGSFEVELASDVPFSTAPTMPQTPRKGLRESEDKFSTPKHQLVRPSNSDEREGEPQPKTKTPTRSTKRTLGSPNTKNKRQQTLDNFKITKSLPNEDPPSFGTNDSLKAPSVFSGTGESRSFSSNDTSMMSTELLESQDLGSTQEWEEFSRDPEVQRSYTEAYAATVPHDPCDIVKNTPFKIHNQLPWDVPFWLSWEIHRLAAILEIEPDDLYRDLTGQARRDFTSFWDSMRKRCLEERKSLPPKSNLQSWTTENNQYENNELNKVVYQTGELDWAGKPAQGLLHFRLNALQQEQSCRLQRKFGADRFLLVSAPMFSSSDYPAQVRQFDKREAPLCREVTDFLAGQTHYIAGRYWRVCYVEPEKTKVRRKKQHRQQPPRLKIVLFAEAGYDIATQSPPNVCAPMLKVDEHHLTITLEQLVQWHIPIDDNLKSTDLKLFSRWSLGFSKTTPTIELRQDEFLYRHDVKDRPVMDDGCARMSLPLAKAIWAAYGGQGPPPSAVQGRIAGGKGLWIVDYADSQEQDSDRGYWIEVSDSQLKIKPHPRDRADADAFQRTFEVLKFAGDCHHSHLNLQLITILEDRGVPREVLRLAMEADIKSYSDSLKDAMEAPQALRLWFQEHANSSGHPNIDLLGSFPFGYGDQAIALLESGFHPKECKRLSEIAQKLLDHHLSNYVERMWIDLPQSTVVFCAPDPLGILAPNEVYLGFRKEIIDPRTGLHESALHDIDVLLARNPAYLASDIQLRRAVYKPELRHYKNVILFSTQGDTPTASLLSGGDYDGDTCTCVWDPSLVSTFRPAKLPKIPTEGDCGMLSSSRALSSVFRRGLPFNEALGDYLKGCVAFNSNSSFLGKCSSEHEKLVYSYSLARKTNKLSDPNAVKLAALAGYLVDSNKQGWSLTDKQWHKVRRQTSGRLELAIPAFKEDYAPYFASYLNVMDFLKFEVAKTLRDQALEEFTKRNATIGSYDHILSSYWKQADLDLEEERKRLNEASHSRSKVEYNRNHSKFEGGRKRLHNETPALLTTTSSVATLRGLLREGDNALETKIRELRETMTNEARPVGSQNSDEFRAKVREAYEQFTAIEPIKVDHELRRRFDMEKRQDHQFPYWSLLRASCLHFLACQHSFPVWVWYVAGRELCFLKALHHEGGTRLLTTEMHELMKVNTKYAKKLLEGAHLDLVDVPDDDEDELEYETCVD